MPVRHGQTPARRLRPAGKRMLWRAGRGFVVSFDYTDDAMRKADAFFRRSGESIVLFTVQETLEEHLAKKLA